MSFDSLFNEMSNQLASKKLFEQSKEYAYDYLNNVKSMNVYPADDDLLCLDQLTETMPAVSGSSSDILKLLHEIGSKTTVAQTGGKYFGFVNGGVTPTALAVKWLTDIWDQNAALYVISPISSRIEELCEKWLVELLHLPEATAAGFVSGSSTAIICALAAARNELLSRQNWDVAEKGLFEAPLIRVVIGEQAHSSVWKALSMLGIGKGNVKIVPADPQGRMIVEKMPQIDSNTLIIAQAGNVNGGAFDPIDSICDIANQAGAWVHIDGAFGLWAAACAQTRHLTSGLEKANSWSVDAHKTLNAPYDCGIVLCKERSALIKAMQATGSYIQYSEHRDGMLYTPEMSRRARGIELWATLKFFGKSGINELISRLCELASYFANQLFMNNFIIENEVVFNQIIVRCHTSTETTELLKQIQLSGKCWCGGATWKNEPVIRISVCSWQTTISDIDECIELFIDLRRAIKCS